MKRIISVLVATAIILLTLCSCTTEIDNNSTLSIVCTAFPQYDFVKNIIGSDEGLTLLLDDGADLHSYEPTAGDIIKIGSADIFIYVGGVSDDWSDGVIRSANNPDLKSIALMDLVDTLKEEYVSGMQQENHIHEHQDAHSGNHIGEDEHIWLSIKNAITITSSLCDAICEADPENSEKYHSNAENYISELKNLDSEYKNMISTAKRKTVLFADRFPFRYLTEDYNLTYYAAFAGCSSESEASFETLAFLINKTKELNLTTILTIEGSDGLLAKTICESTGSKTAVLDSCQSVSLSDIANGTSYLNIMKNNLEILQEALN